MGEVTDHAEVELPLQIARGLVAKMNNPEDESPAYQEVEGEGGRYVGHGLAVHIKRGQPEEQGARR